jgi:hypothetical protein
MKLSGTAENWDDYNCQSKGRYYVSKSVHSKVYKAFPVSSCWRAVNGPMSDDVRQHDGDGAPLSFFATQKQKYRGFQIRIGTIY